MSSIVIGIGAGFLCYTAVSILKPAFGYDDSLDVFGIHGIGGTWGALATGLFASVGAKGLFFGNPGQMIPQVIGVLATWVLAIVVTFVILIILDALIGLRVTEEEEVEGLDLAQHGESGYNL
jgi:Amt family ammonium transporter